MTVTGLSSSTDFPTTIGAYDSTYNGSGDAFVSRLDPDKSARAQLSFDMVS